ncbi:hypothetical protein CLU79DRAFT_697136, partial [Phycomyces nitens]
IHDMKNLAMDEILAVVSQCTCFFDDKLYNSLVQLCIRRNIHLMKTVVSRKRTKTKNEKIGFRVLYVIKHKYIKKIAIVTNHY